MHGTTPPRPKRNQPRHYERRTLSRIERSFARQTKVALKLIVRALNGEFRSDRSDSRA